MNSWEWSIFIDTLVLTSFLSKFTKKLDSFINIVPLKVQ